MEKHNIDTINMIENENNNKLEIKKMEHVENIKRIEVESNERVKIKELELELELEESKFKLEKTNELLQNKDITFEQYKELIEISNFNLSDSGN
jgi:hypothetical protein